MIASGSIEGSPYCTSRVATSFTQSVEPGSGTSSILLPPNHPILVAIANGEAAELTVRAHQATRTVVCADAEVAAFPIAAAASKPRTTARVMTDLLFSPAQQRRRSEERRVGKEGK